MWTLKARLTAVAAVGLALVSVASAQWLPLLLATALALQLTYARVRFQPDGLLEGDRAMALGHVPEGEVVDVSATVQNTGTSTAFLQLRDTLPRQLDVKDGRSATIAALGPGDRQRLSYELSTPLMGVYDVGPLEARIEDAFGLFVEEEVARAPDELVVVPAQGEIEEVRPVVSEFQTFQGEYAVNRPGDGFDFYGLREYVPGDVYRAINWKASAKTGDLMVNQFERTTSTEITFLVDGRAVTQLGPESTSPFVQSARAITTLLEEAFDKRDTPRIVLYGDGLHTIHPGPPDRLKNETLETLAMWAPGGDEPLGFALEEILPRLKPGTPVVLLSPLVDDPTILESVTRMLAHDLEVLVVAPPIPDLEETPRGELETLKLQRQRNLEGLQGFELQVVEPRHLHRPAGVLV